jgi:hypothetical protein
MYHYNLAFVLVGMSDQVVSIFSHLFRWSGLPMT